jgi:hypothetical protein
MKQVCESKPYQKYKKRGLKGLRLTLIILLMSCSGVISLRAQSQSEHYAVDKAAKDDSVQSQKSNDGSDYIIRRGTNEFGVWGGGSFLATAAFGGLRKDEVQGRRSIVTALRYGRTLAATRSMALQYTLDVIPLAVATNNITQRTTVITPTGSTTTFRRGASYGGGLTPLGLQLDFRNSARVKPFVHVNAGGLIFTKPVPLPDAGKFAFTLEGGTGARIFTSTNRAITLGLRFHHISNGNLSGSNRGLNEFIVYMGFSAFRR